MTNDAERARTALFVILVAAFTTCLLIADIVAGKFFTVMGLDMSVGTVAFPVTFILTDIVNEYYGRRGARFMTNVGMAMLTLGFTILYIARVLPPTPNSPLPQSAMEAVFGMSARMFAASMVAFLVSQLVDIASFQAVKSKTQSRHLWLRAVGSTVMSQVVDTIVVNVGMLLGKLPSHQIASVIVVSYFYKVAVATVLTPLCYLAHDVITRRYGIEPMPHEVESL